MKTPNRVNGHVRATVIVAALALCFGGQASRGQQARRASLACVGGSVRSIETVNDYAQGELVALRLAPVSLGSPEVLLVLAPREVLEQSGFDVGIGDQVKARIFVPQNGTAEAHEVDNLSSGTSVRLRSLRRVPLWDDDGKWRGGACRRWGGRYGRRGLGAGCHSGR